MVQGRVIFVVIICVAHSALYAQGKSEENIPHPPDSLKFIPPVVVEPPAYLINGDTVFESYKLDTAANYPGGMREFFMYLHKNLTYPVELNGSGVQGKVVLKAIVEKTGHISHVTVKKPVHAALDEEAIRVLVNSGNWIPGRKNGKAVHSYISLPIYINWK